MKLPLSFSLKNRDSDTAKDARVLNGYVEVIGDKKKGGTIRTFKRPALDSAFELTAGAGQALYVPNTPDGDGEPGVVIGDILTRAPTAVTKKLAFGVQPSNATLNVAISPSVTVRILNSLGALVNSGANVTVALLSNAAGATLGGTLTQAAVAGTATFNDLTLNRSGEDFTLRATSTGLTAATSNTFDLTTALVFTVQPSPSAINTTFTAEVTVRDTAGATDTNYNGNVTVSIYSATAAGVLSGTLTVAAVAGVATFSNLEIDVDGTYSLLAVGETIATAYPPTRIVSNSFAFGYTLVAGQFFTNFGFETGFYGSLSPTTFNGLVVNAWFSNSSIGTRFAIVGNVSQSFVTSITGNSITLPTSGVTSFSFNGTSSIWTWNTTQMFTGTGTFQVQIV